MFFQVLNPVWFLKIRLLKGYTVKIIKNINFSQVCENRPHYSLSTRVSAFISLALVVVLVVQNNNYRISNFNRIRLYLTQIIILKLIQVILDQLLILNAIKLDPILFYIKHDWGNILWWISCYYVFLLHTKKSHKLCTERPNECYFCKGVKFYSRP